jgi:spore coat polysaccharide biosynthesis protein SpsF (cytidylyltransferase family)
MNNKFEIPARDKITITSTDDWVSISQVCSHVDEQRVAIHIDDLKKVIDFLCEISGYRPAK